MIRRLYRWLTPLAVLALWTAVARAADTEGEPPGRVPVLGGFLAFVFMVATMVIICMPSRKS